MKAYRVFIKNAKNFLFQRSFDAIVFTDISTAAFTTHIFSFFLNIRNTIAWIRVRTQKFWRITALAFEFAEEARSTRSIITRFTHINHRIIICIGLVSATKLQRN